MSKIMPYLTHNRPGRVARGSMLKKSHPWYPGYALPRNVWDESSSGGSLVTRGVKRGTGRAAPVYVSPGRPRGTITQTMRNQFYTSSLDGNTIGRSSLGDFDGGYGSLGADYRAGAEKQISSFDDPLVYSARAGWQGPVVFTGAALTKYTGEANKNPKVRTGENYFDHKNERRVWYKESSKMMKVKHLTRRLPKSGDEVVEGLKQFGRGTGRVAGNIADAAKDLAKKLGSMACSLSNSGLIEKGSEYAAQAPNPYAQGAAIAGPQIANAIRKLCGGPPAAPDVPDPPSGGLTTTHLLVGGIGVAALLYFVSK